MDADKAGVRLKSSGLWIALVLAAVIFAGAGCATETSETNTLEDTPTVSEETAPVEEDSGVEGFSDLPNGYYTRDVCHLDGGGCLYGAEVDMFAGLVQGFEYGGIYFFTENSWCTDEGCSFEEMKTGDLWGFLEN